MPSFDVVSELNMQELRNAVDQASRETATRYDFRGTDTTIALSENEIVIEADSEGRYDAAVDILQSKVIRRGLSLKVLDVGEAKPASGARVRGVVSLQEGIPQDAAKELNKHIKDLKLKVQVQIQGEQLRVTGKKRDDLQAAIAALKELDFRLPLQYNNFRD